MFYRTRESICLRGGYDRGHDGKAIGLQRGNCGGQGGFVCGHWLGAWAAETRVVTNDVM
jgi:hypothetical protein